MWAGVVSILALIAVAFFALVATPITSHAATFKTTVLPEAEVPVGSYTFGPANVQNSATSIQFEATRVNWPDAARFTVQFDLSMDNGQTWTTNYGNFGMAGGILFDRQGNLVTNSTARWNIPSGNQRRVRGSLDLTGANITTEITFTVD